MLNILVPLAGKSRFFDEDKYAYPYFFVDIMGKTLIERVIENLEKINVEKKFIFVVSQESCDSYHLDNVLSLIPKDPFKIVRVEGATKGAACSCLLAVDQLDLQSPLLIANGDQILDTDLTKALSFFDQNNFDAGVITFDSVHSRWSYVRLGDGDSVIETAEKRPISRNAIAGTYYYSRAELFIESAKRSIKKDARIHDQFYVAPTLNELILEGLSVGHYKINNKDYHTLYTPQAVNDYIGSLKEKEGRHGYS